MPKRIPRSVRLCGLYLWKHRSGALLWLVLTIMLTTTIYQNWPFFFAIAGTGVYVELVHIRTVLKQILALTLAGKDRTLLLRMLNLTLVDQQPESATDDRRAPRT